MSQTAHPARPWALVPAAALLVLQGLGFAVLGVLELASTQAVRPVVGITTGITFLGYAVLLVAAGRGVWRARRWARGVAAFSQILHVPVAWGFAGGGTTPIAYGVIGLSVLVLVLLFLPASTAAFLADPGPPRGAPAD